MNESEEAICDVCGDPIKAGQQALLLNRFGVSNGSSRSLIAATDEDGECIWETDPDPNYRDRFTGNVMHWPICATMFVDGEILELNVRARAQGLNP